MRSSRIARQTAQVVEALSSPRKVLRNAKRITDESIAELKAEGPDQGPSSPHQTPAADHKIAVSSISSSTRKRKRNEQEPDPALIPEPGGEVSIQAQTRVSPRKAGTHVTPKKARRQPAKKIKGEDGAVTMEPPPNWEHVYSLTKEMRSMWPAPVDTMGCESLAEDKRSPKERRFQTLIALMLSSQTKDTVTAVAMKNLQEGLPGGFTLESMRKVEPATLNNLIIKVGFHNNKTAYIKKVVEILAEQHGGDIPDSIDGLVALPGVGPKMAYLCMSAAWGRDEGIGVDVHVHRITNLWGWHKTANPEETRAMLESWLPREKWHDINHLLVGFGQTWCPPVGRKCNECRLGQQGLCPSAVVAKDVKKRLKKETIKTEDNGGNKIVKEEVRTDTVEEPVKAEELSSDNQIRDIPDVHDIEDIAQGTRRRSRRLVQ
ncbi:MAG: hypothetical protein Q9159_006158 [Coniocarpon cinnabarinum]